MKKQTYLVGTKEVYAILIKGLKNLADNKLLNEDELRALSYDPYDLITDYEDDLKYKKQLNVVVFTQ